MNLLSRWPWIFSLKTFVSLLLTLYLAFLLDLQAPYWSALTVYVVAQPLNGALRSKATYRFLGTVLGAVVSVILVPNLVNAPELLSLALAGWIGLCLYISLLDRSPRSYIFLLAGYSVSFIALPAVAAPANIFALALARVEEITLAIACTTLIDTIFFPLSAGPMLTGWVNRTGEHARQWVVATLRQQTFSRSLLAADLGLIIRLADNLAYDASGLKRAVRPLDDLHSRLMLLFPALSSLADRLHELKGLPGGIPRPLQQLLEDAALWCSDGGEKAREKEREGNENTSPTPEPLPTLETLLAAIRAQTPPPVAGEDWSGLIRRTVLLRLREILELAADCRSLRAWLAGGARGEIPRLVHHIPQAVRVQHIDHGMALWSGLAAALAVFLWCVAWIELAWPDGAVAVEMAAVVCCFFATLDDPAPLIRSFGIQQIPGFLAGIVYVYAILPMVSGFEMLSMVLAPNYLLAGAMLTVPAFYGWGLGLAESTTMSISWQTSYSGNFAATLNGDIAVLLGVYGASVLTGMVRSVGAAWTSSRLVRANQQELLVLVRQKNPGARQAAARRNHLVALMMDRLGQMLPRMAAGEQASRAIEAELTRLRVGLNIVEMQRLCRNLPAPEQATVMELLEDLGGYIQSLGHHGRLHEAPPALLQRVDAALRAVSSKPEMPQEPALVLAVVGIRRGLFPDAPPWLPVAGKEPDNRKTRDNRDNPESTPSGKETHDDGRD